ncbi:MAG: PilZ domain-containing protein [Thermoanaerobaculia bacterium]
MFDERRRHPRLVIPLEAQYWVKGSESPRLGTIENLSAGGATLITGEPLEVGTELSGFRFTLPPEGSTPETIIEVNAVVVRSVPHRGVGREEERHLGLTFVYPDDDQFKLVQDFVFNRLRRGDRGAGHIPIEKRRIPFREPVIVAYDKFEEFVEEVSENLSMNGMFVRSIRPKRPGTVLSFEFRLGEDMSLIQGQAEVAWRRPTTEGPDQPAGMGVRFLKIDLRSRDLIKRLVKEHTMRKMLAEGALVEPPTPKPVAKPVESPTPRRVAEPVEPASALAAAAEVVVEALQPVLNTDAPAEAAPDFPVPAPQPAETSDRGSKAPLLVSVIGVGLVVALALAYWLPQRGARPVAEEPPVPESGAVAQLQATPPPAPTAEVPDPTGSVEEALVEETSVPAPELPELFEAQPTAAVEPAIEKPAPVEVAGSGDLSTVDATVLAWAQAWSGQQVDDYLGFYASEFNPPDGLSRDEWETQRFNRLRKPAWIKVELDGLRQQPIGADRVSVTFSQAYSSDTFSDSVAKTIELVWEDGAWKIASENSG